MKSIFSKKQREDHKGSNLSWTNYVARFNQHGTHSRGFICSWFIINYWTEVIYVNKDYYTLIDFLLCNKQTGSETPPDSQPLHNLWVAYLSPLSNTYQTAPTNLSPYHPYQSSMDTLSTMDQILRRMSLNQSNKIRHLINMSPKDIYCPPKNIFNLLVVFGPI